MMNSICLIGRLTKDPERRTTQSGVTVVSFAVACDRDYKQDGEYQTDFFNVTAWRQTGEFVDRYFTKGKLIGITGRLEQTSWQDRDGNTRRSVQINATSVCFAGSKSDSEQPRPAGGYAGQPATAAPAPRTMPQPVSDYPPDDYLDGDSDLPF